jgi:hypothetical protein
MKKIVGLSIAFILLFTKAYTQSNLPSSSESELIIQLDSSISKDAIYSDLKLWISDYFKNSKAVLDAEDKESGYIILKPIFSLANYSNRLVFANSGVSYSLKFQIKNSKFKVLISNIQVISLQGQPFNESIILYGDRLFEGQKNDLFKITNEYFNEIFNTLKTIKISSKSNNSDW